MKGGSADSFMTGFADWFQQNFTKLGDKKAKDNDCPSAAGLDFDLQCEIVGVQDSRFTPVGQASSNADAPLTMVRARLLCAGTPLTGKQVVFDTASGPGTVNPGTNTTESSGGAAAAFTAGDADAVLHAACTSCESGNPTVLVKTLAMRDAGDGTAPVEGSGTLAASGYGSSGECATTITGTVTFSVSGTLITDADGSKGLFMTMGTDFNTWQTIECPGDPPVALPCIVIEETYDFSIPVENGCTIENTLTQGPITSHVRYVLTY